MRYLTFVLFLVACSGREETTSAFGEIPPGEGPPIEDNCFCSAGPVDAGADGDASDAKPTD